MAPDSRVAGHDLKDVRCCVGRELQQQVAQLQSEYSRVGDQLESEQTRIMQVCPAHCTAMLQTLLVGLSKKRKPRRAWCPIMACTLRNLLLAREAVRQVLCICF